MADTLGVPAAAHAAQLVREGLLPRQVEVVGLEHMTALLLSMAATPNPEQAAEALVAVATLPLQACHALTLDQFTEAGGYRPASAEERARLPSIPFDAIGAAIEGWRNVVQVLVAPGEVVVNGALEAGQSYRAMYAFPNSAMPTGLRRVVEIKGEVFPALGAHLYPDWPRALQASTSAVQSAVLH